MPQLSGALGRFEPSTVAEVLTLALCLDEAARPTRSARSALQ
jgi:hypothetical protein